MAEKIEKTLWERTKSVARVGVTGLAGLAGMASLGGCYYPPQFFSCNYWVDRDQDGKSAPWEFEGVKSEFRSFETVTLVATVYNQRGAKLRCEVWSPAGILVGREESVVSFDVNIKRTVFPPHMLKTRGGVGRYRAVWYLGDNPINTTDFVLID